MITDLKLNGHHQVYRIELFLCEYPWKKIISIRDHCHNEERKRQGSLGGLNNPQEDQAEQLEEGV